VESAVRCVRDKNASAKKRAEWGMKSAKSAIAKAAAERSRERAAK